MVAYLSIVSLYITIKYLVHTLGGRRAGVQCCAQPAACLQPTGRSEKGGIIFFELPECPLSSPLTAKNILPRQKSGKKSKIFFAAAKYFAVRGDDFCRWGALPLSPPFSLLSERISRKKRERGDYFFRTPQMLPFFPPNGKKYFAAAKKRQKKQNIFCRGKIFCR